VIDLIAGAGSRWLSLMWPLAWQGTIVALVALALLPLARRAGPPWALGLLGVAMLKFFVPPVATSPVAFVDAAAAAIRPAGRLDGDEIAGAGLLLVHLAGILVVGVRVWNRQRWLSGVIAESASCDRAEVVAEAERLARRMQLRTVPDVRRSSLIEAPMAAGVNRPVVLLPSTLLDRLSPEQLAIVVAHELAHHRARDLRLEWLIAMATTIWWFHPVVWTLAGQLRSVREDRCDDRVIALGVDPHAYCRVLLDVAAARLASPAIAMREMSHPLQRRFARLLSGRGRRAASPVLALAGTLLFAGVALPHSSWPRADDDETVAATVVKRVQVAAERRVVSRVRAVPTD
jgi:bla regulator protein blaR1